MQLQTHSRTTSFRTIMVVVQIDTKKILTRAELVEYDAETPKIQTRIVRQRARRIDVPSSNLRRKISARSLLLRRRASNRRTSPRRGRRARLFLPRLSYFLALLPSLLAADTDEYISKLDVVVDQSRLCMLTEIAI